MSAIVRSSARMVGLTPQLAGGALRLSLGRDTTSEQVDSAATVVVDAVRQVRRAVPAQV